MNIAKPTSETASDSIANTHEAESRGAAVAWEHAESQSDAASRRVAEFGTAAEIIAAEMAAIEGAIQEELAHIPQDLRAALDLSALTRRFPWPTVGLAAGLGFAVAHYAFPSRAGEVQASMPPHDRQVGCAPVHGSSQQSTPSAPSSRAFAILSGLLGMVLRAAMPLLMQWLRPVLR